MVIASEPATGDNPASAAISVVTVGELVAGVLLARTARIREFRQARLDRLRRIFQPIAVDDAVAKRYGELLAHARRERRTTQAADLLILATALAHERTLVTRDERQGALAEAAGIPARLVA